MMRKYCLLGILIWGLSGCATLHTADRSACAQNHRLPSFFAQGEQLAAFRLQAQAKQYGLEGILQIKKQAEETYEVTLFSNVGAYRLLQGTLTREGMQYSYLAPGADQSAVQVRVERFLTLLLIPSLSQGSCKVKKESVQISYKHPIKKYEYAFGASYPQQAIGPKPFGKTYLTFDEYQPYGQNQLPHTLWYRDGKIYVSLTLLRLKK